MHYHLEPAFLAGSKGRVFNLHFAPLERDASSTCVVLAPPLEEEMNRCRYMTNMLGQRLTGNGIGLLITDPYGTGDSQGDFRDTEWSDFCDDLRLTAAYARELGYQRILLLGIRMGALHALEVAPTIDGLEHILLWQPVVNGQGSLTQLLRIRIAASLGRDETAGTVKEFDAMSEDGRIVEVSGYEFSPPLYQALKAAHMNKLMPAVETPITWMTSIASAERKPPRAETSVISKWQGAGKDIDYRLVVGPPYWQVHERTLSPDLVEVSSEVVMEVCHAG